MDFFELQPTDENILYTFEHDLLRRDADVLYFADMLNSINSSCSIALDARWGSGKTFFIKHVKMVLDAFNDYVELSDDKKTRVKSVVARIRPNETKDFQPLVSVYYDAWLNDNDEDPIISLVWSITQDITVDYKFTQDPRLSDAALAIIESLSGFKATEIVNSLKSEDILAGIKKSKDLHNQVSEFMSSLLPERGNRLVIFIDELDRCNPAFAVKLLERIKHYFNNESITFVFSVNIEQLQHTIRSCYGGEFDGAGYLERFFDFRVDLPPANFDGFYKEIGLNNGSYVYEKVCKEVIEKNNFSIREIAKFYRMARTAAYKPTHDSATFDLAFSEGKAIEFCLSFVVPIIIGLRIKDYSKYRAFISGEDSSPLHDIIDNTNFGRGYRNLLLSGNETFNRNDKEAGRRLVTMQDKVDSLYDAMFIHKYTERPHEINIGELTFDDKTREVLLRVASALSRYSDFEV